MSETERLHGRALGSVRELADRAYALEEALREIGNILGGPTMRYAPNIEIREWHERVNTLYDVVVRALRLDFTASESQVRGSE